MRLSWILVFAASACASPGGVASRAPAEVPTNGAKPLAVPGCQRTLSPWPPPGRDNPSWGPGGILWLGEGAGQLYLSFEGTEQPVYGGHYPMRLQLSGRQIHVVIEPHLRWDDDNGSPGGTSIPEKPFSNRGAVLLPPSLSGGYELVIQQGSKRARYTLEISPERVEVHALDAPPQARLAFPQPYKMWRMPADAAVLRCGAWVPCDLGPCEALLAALQDAALPPLEEGPYLAPALNPSGYYLQCNLHAHNRADVEKLWALAKRARGSCIDASVWTERP